MIFAILWLTFVPIYYFCLAVLWLAWQMIKLVGIVIFLAAGGVIWLLAKMFGALRAK